MSWLVTIILPLHYKLNILFHLLQMIKKGAKDQVMTGENYSTITIWKSNTENTQIRYFPTTCIKSSVGVAWCSGLWTGSSSAVA